jgi:hypothetical protein
MRIKSTLEAGAWLAVIILCVISMLLVVFSGLLFSDTKVVYQAF